MGRQRSERGRRVKEESEEEEGEGNKRRGMAVRAKEGQIQGGKHGGQAARGGGGRGVGGRRRRGTLVKPNLTWHSEGTLGASTQRRDTDHPASHTLPATTFAVKTNLQGQTRRCFTLCRASPSPLLDPNTHAPSLPAWLVKFSFNQEEKGREKEERKSKA
ncbi:hypothetical protein E2C01_037551 [Portunus trituberculatus]|uniref:Uncharacterized protein n=1 Tax=Portunus trituberculatus TaxID=210409 RepID=A0A5B7FEW7_PORTR|nr:hypothetical protein [Portunus trituberculatus]